MFFSTRLGPSVLSGLPGLPGLPGLSVSSDIASIFGGCGV